MLDAAVTDVQAFARGMSRGGIEDSPDLRDRAQAALYEFENAYRALGPRRDEYRAGRNGVRGLHFEGTVVGPDGRTMGQREYMEMMNRRAEAFNLVEPQLRQVVGQFRQNKSERDIFPVGPADADAVEAMNVARRSMRRETGAAESEADGFMTHLVGGWSMHRSEIEQAHSGPWNKIVVGHQVHVTRGFYNTDVSDRRMRDVRVIGEIMDVTAEQLAYRFARSAEDAVRILGLYGIDPARIGAGPQRNGGAGWSQDLGRGRWGFAQFDGWGFRETQRAGMHRLIVGYKLEYDWRRMATDPLAFDPAAQAMEAQQPGFISIPQGDGPLTGWLAQSGAVEMQNAARRMQGLPEIVVRGMEYMPVWRYYMLTGSGGVVRYGDATYWHGEHPYTVTQAMHLDGETWGMVGALMAPQNRLNAALSQIDHAIRTGLKPTLILDKQARIDSGLTQQQVVEALARGDAAIELETTNRKLDEVVYETKAGQLPAGAFDVIALMPQLMERISGVTEAAQGITPKSGTTATQYERSTAQSGQLTYIYTDTYFEGLQRKDRKDVRLLQQALDQPAQIHDPKTGVTVDYDPARARAMRFDVAMGAAADTPTARLANEQMLREDFAAGALDAMTPGAKIYFKRSGRPDAPMILRDIEEAEQQQKQQQLAALTLQMEMAGDPAAQPQPAPQGAPR